MTASVTVSIHIPVPRPQVWEDVADLAGHVEWMADARRIEFLTEARGEVGTRMAVETRFGPLRTTDVMEVTAWEPCKRIAVDHRGLFTGRGEFRLADEEAGTLFTWTEHIAFPWYFGGPIGAWLARPVLAVVWRRNLSKLRSRFISR